MFGNYEVRFDVLSCEKACVNPDNLGQGQFRVLFSYLGTSLLCVRYWIYHDICTLKSQLNTPRSRCHGVKKCKFVLASRPNAVAALSFYCCFFALP